MAGALDPIGYWVRATEGSDKDKVLRTSLDCTFFTFVVVVIWLVAVTVYDGMVDQLTFCYGTIAIIMVCEAFIAFIPWRRWNR